MSMKPKPRKLPCGGPDQGGAHKHTNLSQSSPGVLPKVKLLASKAVTERRLAKRKGLTASFWCWLHGMMFKAARLQRCMIEAARQSGAALMSISVAGVRQGSAFLLSMDKWKVLDRLWDTSTVFLFFVDIVCDAGVLLQFYTMEYYGLFKAGCSIVAISQLSYAFVFVVKYPPRCGTDLARVKLFLKILPVAQLVPFFMWLQSLEIPAINCYLSWIDAQVPEHQVPDEHSNKALQYMHMKIRNHAGFIVEAFSEAIPQCLLQTAAICMYPELASPFSIFSILSSVIVIASKGYLFSFSTNVPTRAFGFLCIIADLLNVFATTTWVFANSSLTDGWEHTYLLRCFGWSAYHGCLGCVVLAVATLLWEIRSQRQIVGFITAFHIWTFFFSFVQTLLLLLPGVVLLAILKLSLIPILGLRTLAAFESESNKYFCFEEKTNRLLDPALPKAWRERRICVVNLFTSFAQLRMQEGVEHASLPDMCLKDVCRHMCERSAYTLHSPDSDMQPVLVLSSDFWALRKYEDAHQGLGIDGDWDTATIIGYQLIWNISGKTTMLTSRTHATLRMTFNGEELTAELRPDGHLHWSDGDEWTREEVSMRESVSTVQFFVSCAFLLWKKAVGWSKMNWAEASDGDLVRKVLYICSYVLGVYSLPHIFFSVCYAVLFVGQGMLYPVFCLSLFLWHAGVDSMHGLHNIQILQIVLSVGFSACIITLAVLLPWIKRHLADFQDVLFYHQQIPGSFFCSEIADAMEKACFADDRRLGMVKSLHQKGLSSPLLAEVMTYVGPVKYVRRMPKVAKNPKQRKSKHGRR